jgi:hypothetical protein
MDQSNSTTISSPPLLPIEVLLSMAGFLPFSLITFQFVMPSVGCVGSLFCMLSVYVFFRAYASGKGFNNEPVYVYFKVIAIIYLIHLLALIPHGFCFTAYYFPQMDVQACILFQLVYIPFSNVFFHYTGILELIIVLDRMKV